MLKAEQQVARLQRKLKGVGGALASAGAGVALQRSVSGGADLVQTQIRLQALSEQYGEFDRIQKLVTQNAETFNQSQRQAAKSFSDVYARLRVLGIELDDIQSVYQGFNAVALASGTSAREASAAFTQLSQALGSGRLQGDEFRSIAEQVPGILKLVADEMGVTVGELKNLGSEGKITADILINALAKGFEQNKDKIQQIINLSPAQKFQEFSNSVSDLGDAMGTELLPVITPVVQGMTGPAGSVWSPSRTDEDAYGCVLWLGWWRYCIGRRVESIWHQPDQIRDAEVSCSWWQDCIDCCTDCGRCDCNGGCSKS